MLPGIKVNRNKYANQYKLHTGIFNLMTGNNSPSQFQATRQGGRNPQGEAYLAFDNNINSRMYDGNGTINGDNIMATCEWRKAIKVIEYNVKLNITRKGSSGSVYGTMRVDFLLDGVWTTVQQKDTSIEGVYTLSEQQQKKKCTGIRINARYNSGSAASNLNLYQAHITKWLQ